jgi:amino acid transporter
MGSKTATAVGIITILGYIIAFAGIYVFVGSYIVSNLMTGLAFPGLTPIVTVLYGILVTAPVIVGLKFGVRVSYALWIFEAVLLVVMSLAFLVHGGPQGVSAVPFHWPSTSHDTLLAFSLAILAFGGFEACAPLAEETKDPRKNVPRAVLTAVIVSGLIYVLGSYALVIAFGPAHVNALASAANPFYTAASRYISFLAPVVTWVFLTSVTSSYVAANTQTARVIFGGARGGLWSKVVGKVSPKHHTPANAAIAFVAPSIIIGIGSLLFTSVGTATGFLSTYGILGLIIMYVMANLALIVHWVKHRATENGKIFGRVIVPVVGMLILMVPIYGDLRPGQPAPYNTLPYLTIALILVGILYTAWLARRNPVALKEAPALLEGADGGD